MSLSSQSPAAQSLPVLASPAPAPTVLERLRRFSRRLGRDTRGLSTVEYVLILGLIAVVAVGTWKKFGEQVNTYVTKSNTHIKSKMPKELKGK